MAVIGFREILPRTFSHKFGESPSAEIKYAVTVDEPTPTQAIIAAIGIFHGAPHPEFAYLSMTDASVTESDRHHVEISLRYELRRQKDSDPNPLLRPDVWSFSASGSAVPCTAYFDENDNLKPLVNAADDWLEGLSTEESEVRATVTGNRPSFPMLVAAFVTNTLNDAEYLGCQPYTWKCNGISGQQAAEVVDGREVWYYRITVELAYRPSGWPLIIPDVGWNFKENGVKKRCFVEFDGEQLPTAGPVALKADGSMLKNGPPRLIVRRVHRATNFSNYFGTPTF